MTDSATDYLLSLGAPEVLLKRVSTLLGAYTALLPEDVRAVFVSEYRDEADQRTFEALWLFSDHFAMEAKLLGAEEDQFDFVPHKHGVHHIVIRKRAFDLTTSTDASRMAVEVWFTDQRYGILKSTGDNCLNLTAMLRNHLVPNALPEGGVTSSPS